MLLQRHTPATRPQTTAHLAQTMTLLSLTSAELSQKIDAALASNPALELVDERRCPTCHRRLLSGSPCPFCSRQQGILSGEPIVYISPVEDMRSYSPTWSGEESTEDAYELAASPENLPEFVLRQIATELEPGDRPIAAHILTSLDENGLLGVPLAEIARYHHVLISHVTDVLRLIQHADPTGVGSPTAQEAMLVQLEVLAETRPVPPLAAEAIRRGMNALSHRHYNELGKLLNITVQEAAELARFIGDNLHAHPADLDWGDEHSGARPANPGAYYQADVIISLLKEDDPNSPLVVEVVLPLAGTLRIDPQFREALRSAPPEKAEQWKSDMESASLLVKCLQQRNHTLVRLMQLLATLQREYILFGEAFLIPLTRAHLSSILDVHESTISRAVSSKTAQLPNGHIVPLAAFFDRSMNARTALKEIIQKEGRPLSDTELSKRLAEHGFQVARRTVAKYRNMEGILPAHLRKRPGERSLMMREPATI